MPIIGNSLSPEEVSLYFHIPFCTRKCPYCHFYVLPNELELHEKLLQGLYLEWQAHLPKLQKKKIVSIYFGGGTPSLIGAKALQQILDWIRKSPVVLSPSCEITLEVNPEDFIVEEGRQFAEAGINRISMGVQSLEESELYTLGRHHSSHRAIEAVHTSAQCGITNISIDLLYEIPKQTLTSWNQTLEKLKSLPITHLSLYNLTFEPHTLFYKQKKTLQPLIAPPEENLQMLTQAVASLEAIGLLRYEVSAFARQGLYSRHNTGYWIGRPFLGLGPSAFSYWEQKRWRNAAHLGRYVRALEAGKTPVDFEESLPYPASFRELLAVQLRLVEGVDLDLFSTRHGPLPQETALVLQELLAKGWLEQKGACIRLTKEGFLFYDSVAETLI